MKAIPILLLFGLLCGSTSLFARDTIPPGRVSVAVNPSYFVLGGYYVNPVYHFPQRWSVGATFQGGFELPDFARDQFFEVPDGDVTVDWTYAVGLDVRYRFSQGAYDKGFFVAAALGYEGWEIRGAETATLENWFLSFGAGYNWFPTRNDRLHLGLQYNFIFLLNNTDERNLDDGVFNLRPVVPPGWAPLIIVGWRF
ncbi:MAG: hypothetical protein AAFN92_04390 [Bacteroidota bacterium]